MEVAGWDTSPLAGLFNVEVFSCEVGMVKPEPEIYEHALTRIGLSAEDCLFVGDGGSNELEGARAVGLKTVFVSGVIADLWPDRVEKRGAGAIHTIHRAADLLKLPLFGTA
jgi:putative hydrolase of the HAD superfamily